MGRPTGPGVGREGRAYTLAERPTRDSYDLPSLVARYREDHSGCWLWTGVISRMGYGRAFTGSALVGRRNRQAHRVAYELLVGPIADGLTLDHLCRVKHCVNPAHLEPVTNRENVLRSDGLSAVNARKTHCIRGHEFTPENTRLTPKGRACIACEVVRYRRVAERKKAAAAADRGQSERNPEPRRLRSA